MSKYTTELRFICETASGLQESKGYNDVNSIISSARSFIFSFNYPIFDEEYRSVLETKIIKHFYTREIGYETVGLFKLKLDTKMNEIMSYYNKLYQSELIDIDPLFNTKLTKTHTGSGTDNAVKSTQETKGTNETESLASSTNSSGNNTKLTNDQNISVYSDTPQGALTGVLNNTYLTNATKDNAEGSETNTVQSTDQTASSRTRSNNDTRNESQSNAVMTTDEYVDTIIGYSSENPNKMIQDYRQTLLNIDMQIINDLEVLFMGIW